MSRDERGFTLIELLVVTLVIGILAAIAVPSFLSQRSKAGDAEAKAAARTAQTAMEVHRTGSEIQSYAGAAPAELVELEPTLVEASALAVTVSAGGNAYAVSVTSEQTGTVFTIDRAADGSLARRCTVVAASSPGGCRLGAGTSGTW